MESIISIALISAISLCSLVFYGRVAWQLLRSSPANIPSDRFGMLDAMMAGLVCLFFINLIISGWGKPQTVSIQVILLGCMLYVAIILCIVGLLVFRNVNVIELFGLKAQGWPANGFRTIGWLIAAYPLIFLTQAISYGINPTETVPQEIVSYLVQNKDLGNRLIVIVLAVVIAPLAEEFIFRGYLYGVFRKYSGRFLAAVASALLFATIHLHIPSMAGLFVFALVLTLIYERTSSLWAPILMHATFNAISIIFALLVS